MQKIFFKFIHFFRFCRVLPFDWKTPFGYLVIWLAEFIGVFVVYLIVTPFFCLIFASSSFFLMIIDDMTHDLAAFVDNDVKTSDEYDCDDMAQHFRDIVQLYSDEKQLNFRFFFI